MTQTPEQELATTVHLSSRIRILSRALIKTLDRMAHSSKPFSIVRLDDQLQIAINEPFRILLDTPGDTATIRTAKQGWVPEDLEACNDRIKQVSHFEHEYRTALNPRFFGTMNAEIELIEDEQGVLYRLNCNLGVKPAPWHPSMLQMQQFEW
ncbi:MAG: hypothetical protein AB1861_23820 [Cyanobacteriota bacterium]